MTNKTSISGVIYTKTESDYFAKRQLKRSAGVVGLWGLAVAAVISGDFSAWNFGIGFAGFGVLNSLVSRHGARRHINRSHDGRDPFRPRFRRSAWLT